MYILRQRAYTYNPQTKTISIIIWRYLAGVIKVKIKAYKIKI